MLDKKIIKSGIIFVITILFFSFKATYSIDEKTLQELKANFLNPPVDCRPHTRWWWMGNAGTKEDITWQLEQMHEKGIGGVEQITMGEVYEKGNKPYLSDEYLEMIKHLVKEAKRLGMEVSLNFGGPGWIIGGEWVPEADRSKDMVPTYIDLYGPLTFDGPLPSQLMKTKRSWEHYEPNLSGDEKLLAVVAGKVIDGIIDRQSLAILTSQVVDKSLIWDVPVGHWRLMAFWLKKNGMVKAVDHFNNDAMQRYCDYLGGKFENVIGEEFGKTVESFFCDSFELPNLASGTYWSNELLEEFQKFKGYDLTRYLPAIWWQVGDITPKIRYDVNEFLHHMGLEAFFKTFLGWCEAHGVKGRIQAYGFTTDNLEASGITHIPEMEITAGEKDAAARFDTRIGPKKYVASGAHIYGRNVISTEAYTFMHWRRYRSTLEELKIASDGYLRSGATKFYNHGYCFSPERDVTPTRTIGFAAVLNHHNVWWKYYPLLADYVARCSYLLRQGDFAPDIAIYSPLANQWTLDVLNARKWTREFYWGELGALLISNGYDFDLLNDDALQHIAKIENEKIKILNMEYKVLLLPNIESLPLESMEFVERYVRAGGVVVALERVPHYSTGLTNYSTKDLKVQSIVRAMFRDPEGRDDTAPKKYGEGITYHIKHVIHRQIWWDQRSHILDPFIKTIKEHIVPDFGIDFAYEGMRKNEGLTFMHRQWKDVDIYFVANIQDKQSTIPVTFRVHNKRLWKWNPYNGKVAQLFHYHENSDGIQVPLNLSPYESLFLVFESGSSPHVVQSNFHDVLEVNQRRVLALAGENGTHHTTVDNNGQQMTHSVTVTGIPAPFTISGHWRMILEGNGFAKSDTTLTHLYSWVENPRTKHFSGTGRYAIDFELPDDYLGSDKLLQLDLGKVGNVAEVELNGVNMGTIWMGGQTLDISNAVRTGCNHLEVFVTNTLINRVSNFQAPQPIPEYLVPLLGKSPASFSSTIPPEIGFEPLPASGLLGPVKIKVLKKVRISIE